MDTVSKLAFVRMGSIWVQELPRIYLILQKNRQYDVYSTLVPNFLKQLPVTLVEVITIPPKFSLLRSAIASTFPDADLILVGGVDRESFERYSHEPVDLKFNGQQVPITVIDGTPAVWLSSNLHRCMTTCYLLISTLVTIVRGLPSAHSTENLLSSFVLDSDNGSVVAVQRKDTKAVLTVGFSDVYGYVIVPPGERISIGDQIIVYRC
jgi:hypothetical protein